MHQQNQNSDNMKPYKPSVLSLFTRDLCELPEVYPYDMAQNVPEQAVEPVDEFIDAMLSYSRFHPSEASEWLISDDTIDVPELDLANHPEGIYEVVVVGSGYYCEYGEMDDYELKLVPYKEED